MKMLRRAHPECFNCKTKLPHKPGFLLVCTADNPKLRAMPHCYECTKRGKEKHQKELDNF